MQEFDDNLPTDRERRVRKVTLPSGRTIEVVSFVSTEAVERDLHICPACHSDLVYPTDWEEAGDTRWEVTLRCPNCEWRETSVHPDAAIQRFDEQLDNGTEVLVSDLRRLARANMEAEIERLVAALEADYILPEDF